MRLLCPSSASRSSRRHFRLIRRSALCRWNSTKSLDFSEIDAKWQPRWKDTSLWSSTEAPSGKYMVMPMFPYPSGALHIGHLRNYTISDVIARYRRMSGHHVLHPIGWDAFGLPAENAAIERGVNPADWTFRNIQNMKQQIEAMGGCWDWDKELRTCDPDFYKDTQRIFLKLYEHNLAYQHEAMVNYDPIDKTVLANEQVDANGFSWRSGAKVEQKRLKQWFVHITAYAQELFDDLALLEQDSKWPLRVLAMQKNWLGRSEGASLVFSVHVEADGQFPVPVFTTRADTMFGVQYVAMALDHHLVHRQLYDDLDLRQFLQDARRLDPDTKVGYRLKGVTADSPLAALYPQMPHLRGLPVFAAPYVKSDYGSGAVMGVPAHDTRDFAFWNENRLSEDRSPRQVILAKDTEKAPPGEAFTERGVLSEECGEYSGMESRAVAKQLIKDLSVFGESIARETVGWRMRDWLISRQRYWGTPIPIIHCRSCGAVPVPDVDLPVKLPILSSEQWKGLKGNPLEADEAWLNVECPKCHGQAKRETDTMDTFVDSSWYFLRFADAAASQGKQFMPVDLYIGGVEHAILHLLYARFISKFLSRTEGRSELREPFSRLLTQGMVHGKTYSDPDTGRFLKPDEVDLQDVDATRVKATGKPANVSYEKMSKSKHNGVDPISCMATYGADTTRAHLLFQAPVSEVLDWDETKIAGIQRWFGRVWALAHKLSHLRHNQEGLEDESLSKVSDAGLELARQTQVTISSVTQSYSETYALNTIVSDLMSLSNSIQQSTTQLMTLDSSEHRVVFKAYQTALQLLTPIAPSFAEECWAVLHDIPDAQWTAEKSASKSGFPQPDGSLERLQARKLPCAVQINGKLRFATQIAATPDGLSGEALKAWIIEQIRATPEGGEAIRSKRLDPATAKKVIVVRGGRTVNFVT